MLIRKIRHSLNRTTEKEEEREERENLKANNTRVFGWEFFIM